MDEFTRERPAIDVGRGLKPDDVPERLAGPLLRRGVPGRVRSDDGLEFTAKAVRGWPGRVGVGTLFIDLGSPWGDGHVENFDGRIRDDPPDREIFDTLLEAKVLIE